MSEPKADVDDWVAAREARVAARPETARLGRELMRDKIAPRLAPEDHGKFVAIDTRTGEYEIDADCHTAIKRLRARAPEAVGWLERVGFRAPHRIGGSW